MGKVFGAIDVGTNSIRMLVAEMQDNQIIPRQYKLQTTRIGQGVGNSRYLLPTAIDRTIRVLQEYSAEMNQIGVDGLRTVATSAVREAENSSEFLNEADRIGLNVEVISGEAEAQLSFVGVTRGLTGVTDPTVLDIGGGSTEFIWAEQGRLQVFSVPVGAVRLTENPLVSLGTQKLWLKVFEQLLTRKQTSLVGVGGTVTTLAAIEQRLAVYQPELVHGFILQRQVVRRILECLSSLPLQERQRVVGLQPERADIIIAGSTLLLEIMERMGKSEVIVSESDLLQGLIWSLADSN